MKIKYVYLIFVVVFVLTRAYLFSDKYMEDEYNKEYLLLIENLKSSSKTKVTYNVKILNKNDKFILNIYDSSYDSVEKDMYNYSKYTCGDVIKIKGKISIPQKLNNPRRI